MKNLGLIFGIVRKYCNDTGVSNEECFKALKQFASSNRVHLPVFTYLQILRSLGLIRLSGTKREINLTEKGKASDGHVGSRFHAFMLLLLYFLKWVFVLAFFWPMFLFIQPRQHEGRQIQQ